MILIFHIYIFLYKYMPVKLLWYSVHHSFSEVMSGDDPSKLDGVQYFIYVVTIIVTLQIIIVLKINICH
jgi:hypothetical protein